MIYRAVLVSTAMKGTWKNRFAEFFFQDSWSFLISPCVWTGFGHGAANGIEETKSDSLGGNVPYCVVAEYLGRWFLMVFEGKKVLEPTMCLVCNTSFISYGAVFS